MKKEQLGQYICALLASSPDQEIFDEIPNISLILKAYIAGLERKQIFVENLVGEPDIEKDIPAPFHVLVAQGAVLKSNKGTGIARDFIAKNTDMLLKELHSYFIRY